MQHETVIVLDFGGQYNQLIARRVREIQRLLRNLFLYRTDLATIKAKNPKGIILTGGPNSAVSGGFALPSTPRSILLGRAGAGNLLRQPAHDASAGRPCLPALRSVSTARRKWLCRQQQQDV